MDGASVPNTDENVALKQDVKVEPDNSDNIDPANDKEEIKYFLCTICGLREKYDYFGKEPPFTKMLKLVDDCYVIEDPFLPPKQGQFIILGAHCTTCSKSVCKDIKCSFYYERMYCLKCAKETKTFPQSVLEKLKKI